MRTLVNNMKANNPNIDEHQNEFVLSMDEKFITISETKVCMTKFLQNIGSNCSGTEQDVKRDVSRYIDSLLGNVEIVNLLSEVRHLDDYTFGHSIHVGLLSIYVAILLGFSEDDIYDIGAGAILHDVGKTRIAKGILKKPSKLTQDEYKEIKRHTQYGFEIISSCKTLSKRAAYIAKHHHERLNGSGYPDGLTDANLKRETNIVAIADVYDALVSERIYREKWNPSKVLNYIMVHEKGNFDSEILKVFLKFIGIFPVGTRVLLNNQETGIVIRDNELFPSRPVIKLEKEYLREKSKPKLVEEELDLSLCNELYICECC